jgi:hypothetical protein
MKKDDAALCGRILDACRKQRWYGGEKAQIRSEHASLTRFAYPPATDEQLCATERALGFSLPPLLRTLYSHVAKGGFGPGYGLIGALGGFDEAGNLVDMYQYHVRHAQLIDLSASQQPIEFGKPFDLPDTMWPRFLLYLCDWGDAMVSCLDCETEYVFLVCMGERYRTYVFELHAFSLQEWLERWLEAWQNKAPEQKDAPGSSDLSDDFDPFLDMDC